MLLQSFIIDVVYLSKFFQMKLKIIFTGICLFVGIISLAQTKKEEKKSDKKDSDKKKENLYQELMKDAKISEGMFRIIQKETDYYFEIPDSLLSREYLIVNKVSQVPMQLNEAGVNKGMNFENKFITFEKDKLAKKLWVKTSSPVVESPENDAITISVRDNFGSSVMEFFDIHSYNPDSTSVVVKVNKVFDGKEKSFNDVLANTGVGGSVKSNFSFIRSMKSFAQNIVVRSDLTTSVNEGAGSVPITLGVTSNIVLLSKNPMKPRFEDARVGYFTQKRWFFSDEQHALSKRKMVTRWRLEPKEEDVEKYLQGELVEPKKPIVFYIDPATPQKWRKYIIQGVFDWNKAFERAGFKNAVSAVEPEQDIDLDDVRFSGITYVASPKSNAMGPSVIDPRSGEIIEADIVWWHNVMTSLHNWMRVQTGVTNPQTRANLFTDEQMGESVRFVSSHEVGHTFGLKHNMGASFAFEVDSLRSASFVAKNGISPSIMDYARYNYVAQPEDNIPNINPMIGEYDKYAIEWGYRWFPNQEVENQFLKDFVNQRAKNPLYFYGEQQSLKKTIDPRSQSEDLGNNSVKASWYGLKNLKRVTDSILVWTHQKDENYDKAGKLFTEVINQWQLYNMHIVNNIGGLKLNRIVFDDGQENYQPIDYQRQKQAIDYLTENVIRIPQWLFFNSALTQKTYPLKETPMGLQNTSPYVLAREYQYSVLYELLSDERLLRLIENQLINPNNEKRFSVDELFDELRKHIFFEVKNKKSLNVLERMTQKNYVDVLIVSTQKIFEKTAKKSILQTENHHWCGHSLQEVSAQNINFDSLKRVSEVSSVKRGELQKVLKILQKQKGDASTQAHYQDLILRIKQELSIK